MSFVGPGNGDYLTETTYKYVGPGQGNLAVTSSFTILYGRIISVLLILLLLVLLIVFLMRPQDTTTSTRMCAGPWCTPRTPQVVMGECTFWGDPHLKSFDGGRPSFYGDGEYWIVKSELVKIQGRYMGTQYTKGLAATNKVIVGGVFLHGHTITVGTLESGDMTSDGRPILQNFPSSYSLPDGLGTVTYNGEGSLVDPATAIWDKKVVTMRLPRSVTVTVFRWKNYIDLRITMPKIDGMDGSCGNFNGNPADDTTSAIFDRIGARVPHGENMFMHRGEVAWTATEEKLLGMCAQDKKDHAAQACGGLATNAQKACALDFCFGENEHTLKMTEKLGI